MHSTARNHRCHGCAGGGGGHDIDDVAAGPAGERVERSLDPRALAAVDLVQGRLYRAIAGVGF